MGDEPGIGGAEAVHMFVLNQRNRVQPAAEGDGHAVVQNLFGGDGDGHEARRALAIHAHPRHGDGQAGAQGALAGDIAALGPLLQGRAHDHILHLARINPGAGDRMADGVGAQRLGGRVVEGAAIGLADGRAGGGNNDGFAHEQPP